jgi:polysaccharide deacetylase 2 family uncharacterized protein YibQ
MYQPYINYFSGKLFLVLPFLFLLYALISPPHKSVHAAEIALVIDDLGYNLEVGRRVLNLPGPVTLSLIPFTPNAHALSQLAQDAGQDILLHLPMEAIHSTDHKLENVLQLGMSLDSFQSSLNSSLNALPNCIGVNNHTGSLLTQHRQPMEWLMGTIQDRGLFFLDSRTTPLSLANTIALEWGVPSIKRDVFLDHERGSQALDKAFKRAIHIAKKRGYAVLIAHPHKGSLKFLERSLPELAAQSIDLVPLRALIHRHPVLATSTAVKTSHPVAPAPLPGSESVHTALGL